MLFASSGGGSLAGLLPISLLVAVVVGFVLWQRSRRRAMFLACAEQLGAEVLHTDTSKLSARVRGSISRSSSSRGARTPRTGPTSPPGPGLRSR